MCSPHGGALWLVVCVAILFYGCGSSSVEEEAEDTRPSSEDTHWAVTGEKVLGELREAANAGRAYEASSWEEILDGTVDFDPARAHELAARRDRLLWQFWRSTGHYPNPEGLSSSALLRQLAEYRQYLDQHRGLSEGEIHRIGLKNTVQAARTELWYPALLYFDSLTGLSLHDVMEIHTVPSDRCLKQWPLQSPAYDRISSALSKWIATNEDRMTWDDEVKRFRPADGRFIGVSALRREVSDALYEDIRRPRTILRPGEFGGHNEAPG